MWGRERGVKNRPSHHEILPQKSIKDDLRTLPIYSVFEEEKPNGSDEKSVGEKSHKKTTRLI